MTAVASSTELYKNARFIDIGVNLMDPVFRGMYHVKRKHEDDLKAILARAKNANVKSLVVTGGSLKESQEALSLAKEYGQHLLALNRDSEFQTIAGRFVRDRPASYLQALDEVILSHLEGQGRTVAIGECGLDYDRIHFAPADVQQQHFRSQLALAKKHHLPLFLHSRSAHADLVKILREEGFDVDGGRASGARGGVVHSFTGTEDEASELIAMGFHIGVNGCSLKTEENLKAARAIPLDKLLLETGDAPWCSMTSTHASKAYLVCLPASLREQYLPPAVKPEAFVPGKSVKGRNEPCAIGGVAWVMHKLKDVPFEVLTETVYKNTVTLFGLDELA